MAIIKANGYGHGMLRIARQLRGGADAFGVANMDEALALRAADINEPVVVLQGVFEAAELKAAVQKRLSIVVHHPDQLELLEKTTLEDRLAVWLKVDTGMHRLGFSPPEVPGVWRRLTACPGVAQPPVLMTHLSDAEERSGVHTLEQLRCFNDAVSGLSGEHSIANSAAVMSSPDTHAQWVRPGLMLYGVSPFSDSVAADEQLQPVMTLTTRLIAVNQLKKGDRVGYGGEWVCPRDMPVGVAAIGYGDGYPRHARSGTPVLVNNQRVDLIGRVSMDMISLDLRNQPDAKIGDPVILWGEGLPVEAVAKHASTIAYELLCGVSQRVKIEEAGKTD
jgi:alanine racemase